MRIALVNTNRIKPPIAPIGLEYIAETLHSRGHRVEVLDLCWEDDWELSVSNFFSERDFDIVGITLRNTDDCAFASRRSFLKEFVDIVKAVRKSTEATIVLGGVGFSIMPDHILDLCGEKIGIWGDGEFAFADMADRMERKEDVWDLPNLVWKHNYRWHRNPPLFPSLEKLPKMRRNWVDNRRYFREGGQGGIETKRGCSKRCIYCADPVAKGRKVRVRPPKAVVEEIWELLEQGIDHLHTCDSEFNLPQDHALEVCDEIIRSGLGDRVRWYAYCSPAPFSRELARKMRGAGCVGINFGTDNGDEGMLRRLRRDFSPNDILNAIRICKEFGIAVMLDLLLGSPGESRESIIRTIELVKRADPDGIGISAGVRVYPGTELAHKAMKGELKEGLIGGGDPFSPLFFMEPAVAPFIFELLDKLIGDDKRFFFLDPSRPERNYNYDDNQMLEEAIREGHKGAYWDILRRIR